MFLSSSKPLYLVVGLCTYVLLAGSHWGWKGLGLGQAWQLLQECVSVLEMFFGKDGGLVLFLTSTEADDYTQVTYNGNCWLSRTLAIQLQEGTKKMHLLWICRKKQADVEMNAANFRIFSIPYFISCLRPVSTISGVFDGCTKHPKNWSHSHLGAQGNSIITTNSSSEAWSMLFDLPKL